MKKTRQNEYPENMVNLWERLELKAEKGSATANFVTRLSDIDRELLVVEQPIRISGNMQLEMGQQVEVVFNREDASYTFNAVVVTIDSDNDNLTTLQVISDIRRTQRRRFVRIDIAGNITFKAVELDVHKNEILSLDKKGELLNISAGGILLTTSEQLKQNDLILMNFWLKNSQRLDNILGLVKRLEIEESSESKHDEYLAGIEFITKEKAAEIIPSKLAELLPAEINYFNEALEKLVVQFVYKQQVETRKRIKVNP
jgi:c-di-GMP-binding flagellar brake protein YcgR